MPNASDYAALQVIHEAIAILATWSGTSFSLPRSQPIEAVQSFVASAKEILNWSDQAPAALQIVFDRIHLEHGATPAYKYRPAWALERQGNEQTPRIPYPQTLEQAETGFEQLQADIRQAIAHLNPDNLAQLTLFLEKFGSHLSVGDSDIALIDQAKSTAAIAAALSQSSDKQLALVGGDLMGVQKFIYTISSEGALKSLRARSFYLELATEEVVQQLLTRLNLPRTNVIYAGASKFYLLVAATNGLAGILQQIQKEFNDWLLETFQRKVFLAIGHTPFPIESLQPNANAKQPALAEIWQKVNDQLTDQAFRKFEHQLDRLLVPQRSHQPCKVCHRDDVERLTRLNREDPGSVEACTMCARMFRLGRQLLRVNAIVRSSRRNLAPKRLRFKLKSGTIYHYLFDNPQEALQIADDDDLILLVNDWDICHYQTSQVTPLLYANYAQPSKVDFEENDQKRPGTMQAEEFAKEAKGIERVGYLRMDVDRLSQIFSKGLGQAYTLPRLACLSRQMTYFFKVYLNSLAAHRQSNLPETHQALMLDANHQPHPRPNLLFIYAGGDDLFVSGAWNEVVEFAFDVYQSFRAYTGNHPDITLSAGICITGAKFPLYQAAEEAGDVEKAAKGNGRDSLGLLNAALKWDEWLGNWNLASLNLNDRAYLNSVVEPALFGVFPFIKHLYGEVGQGYTRSFVRNLLNTAQMQEEKIKEAKKKQPDQVQDIRYYLHLPKVAYTLARLPARMLDNADFRQSLMSPYNAPYFRAIATWIELLNRNS
ncbi:MAG: type III-A CRISPR-associated protein Cas10/Csm1 [Scytolyngbya sp. HA4215-MV1]|jgi:CRISPR-associated protein Csm1|nr:type III-A CRISPR-associated protein Cas10/Csm1 [Scytolyngbya sp. HA4215-MV1]